MAALLATGRWSQWGVEAMEPRTPASTSFADLANITLTADCIARGEPVEPCDPYGRPFQPYVVLPARILARLGLGTAQTGAIGIALATATLVAVAVGAVLLARTWRRGTASLIAAQLLLALVATSPAVMLAVERGQVEQLTLLLATVALPLLVARSALARTAGALAGVAAVASKFLAVGLALPFLRPSAWGRRGAPALIAIAVSGGLLLWWLPELGQAAQASGSSDPRTTVGSFGVASLLATASSGSPVGYAPSETVASGWGGIRLASLLAFAVLVAVALPIARRTRADLGWDAATTMTVGAGGILLLPYLLGASHDYRLAFLVPLAAGALAWWGRDRQPLALAMAFLAAVAAATSAAMVPTPQGWSWPLPALVLGDAALMALMALVAAIWLRAAWREIPSALARTLRRWIPDLALIAAITAAVLAVSQPWTGLDTPDSGFYASLAAFGSEVTDRAPIDSYYWTRLGVIAPVHALIGAFGPIPGYAIWRALLLLALVAAAYASTRPSTTRIQAAFVATGVATSSVVLSYLGNPYLTGTALTGIAVVIAAAVSARRHHGLLMAAIAGATVGWLAMVNPVAMLMAGSIWLALTLQSLIETQSRRMLRPLLSTLAVAVGAALATWLAYLAIGRALFPGLDWLGTYLEWNDRIDYRDFASRTPVWLGDIALLVPAAALVAVIGLWWRDRAAQPCKVALVIALTTAGFTAAFLPAMGGITLEAPMYTAMLWPPMLIALGIAVTGASTGSAKATRATILAAAIAAAAIVAAGHLHPGLPFAAGAVIMAAAAAAVIAGARRGATAGIIALAAFLAVAQPVQASRGDLGLYFLSPYPWAYVGNPVEAKVRAGLEVERWLIERTTRDDRVLAWVDGAWVDGDRDLYAAAAFSLWGENRVAVGDTLAPEDVARIAATRPTVIALYGPDRTRLELLRSRLPRNLAASPLECRAFRWPTLAAPAWACLARVSP